MTSHLVQTIYDQYLEIIRKISKKACFEFDECSFNYRLREAAHHTLIEVVYEYKDCCGRHKYVTSTIDITNICYEDLTTCKWVQYLQRLAAEFVNDICPKKFIIKEETKRCRQEPKCWEPFACTKTTTVIKKIKPIVHEPECEVIIEEECPCQCKREPCVPKEKVIIKHCPERTKCGERLFLVDDKKKEHDYHKARGVTDYNDHQWNKPCCKGKPKCSANCDCAGNNIFGYENATAKIQSGYGGHGGHSGNGGHSH